LIHLSLSSFYDWGYFFNKKQFIQSKNKGLMSGGVATHIYIQIYIDYIIIIVIVTRAGR
jgi:hypothetical protein